MLLQSLIIVVGYLAQNVKNSYDSDSHECYSSVGNMCTVLISELYKANVFNIIILLEGK